MSRGLIDRSPDLRTLKAEGYCLRIADEAFLVIDRVQYITAAREVQRAELVMALTLRGDVDHEAQAITSLTGLGSILTSPMEGS